MRRLFQAAVEIVKNKSAKATFPDFHGCGSFHRPPLFFLFCFFFLSLCFHSTLSEKIRTRMVYRLRSAIESADTMGSFWGNATGIIRSPPSNSIGERYSNAEWRRC